MRLTDYFLRIQKVKRNFNKSRVRNECRNFV